MLESNIISREARVDALNKISKENIATLEVCIDQLKEVISSKEITETTLKTISNIWRELDSLRELFFNRLINSMKRGDMIIR